MVIDRIGNVNKIIGSDKSAPSKIKGEKSEIAGDTVSISKEAQAAQELARTTDTVKRASDIRQDKVNEVKAKLARGDYDVINNEILDRVADKIAQALLKN